MNDSWVFRFPKHFSETLDPFAERAISQRLKLSTSVPEIKFIWSHPWGFPETISGYKFLPGIALEQFRTQDLDQVCLGRQLGTVLTELHTMTGVVVSHVSDQLATLRTWIEELDEQLRRFARNTLSSSQRSTIESFFDQYKFDLPSTESVFIHGDLGADHILLNEQKQLSGIIDWSNHTKGNRFRDFVGIWRWGGDPFCAQVFSHYPFEPSLSELAYIRVMGLVSCISRVILVFEQQNDQLRRRAHSLLLERLSEINNRCPYESLHD